METKNHYKITPRSADLGGGWHRGAKIERRGRGLRLRQSLTVGFRMIAYRFREQVWVG